MIAHDVWGKVFRVAGLVVLGVIGAAIFALIFGWFVMLLWNWLMPVIFHVGEIGFWQAFGIIILAKLIFGSVGPGGRHGHGPGRGWKGGRHHGPWAEREDHGEKLRYYREFWEEEGRSAFDRYVDRRKGEEEKPQGEKK
jgi:hypothetical protein